VQIAATGERALKAALLILAKLDYLQDGDKLAVADTDLRAPRRMVRGRAIHAFAVRRTLRAFGKWALACS